MLSVKQGGIKYHFLVFGMTQRRIEPWSLGLLANTLLIRPIDQLKHKTGQKNFKIIATTGLIWFSLFV